MRTQRRRVGRAESVWRSTTHAPVDVVGRCAYVVAYSGRGEQWSPVDQVLWFSLFPDVLHGARGPHVVERLAVLRTPLQPAPTAKTRLVIRSVPVRWWDETVLARNVAARPEHPATQLDAEMLYRLKASGEHTPVGLDDDLPIYVNRGTAKSVALDWSSVEFDVFRGINGDIPFEFNLTGKLRDDQDRIEQERPFLDVTQHFRSSVSDEAVTELSRQLIKQYSVTVGAATLLPARWWSYVVPGTTVLVKVGEIRRLTIVDAQHADLRVGMIDVDMRKPALRRESPADAVMDGATYSSR